MTPGLLLAGLAVGLMAGFLSGLLGIGGGIIMVPFLYLALSSSMWAGLAAPPGSGAAMAHATSLLVIVPTALAGVLAFRRAGVLDARGLAPLMVGAGLAAIPGAWLAGRLPDDALRAVFGFFLLATALRMGWPSLHRWRGGTRPAEAVEGAAPIGRFPPAGSLGSRCLGGAAIGLTSAALGVGGGIVAIPVLAVGMGMALRRVAAASVAIILCAAPVGVLAYMWTGRGVADLPPGSLGFVSLPLALVLLPGAVLMAPLGARVNQRLPLDLLRSFLALLLAGVGVRLLWLHLPGALGMG